MSNFIPRKIPENKKDFFRSVYEGNDGGLMCV